MVDCATGWAFARFVEHNSVPENLDFLRRYLSLWGRPLALHTDRSVLFQGNSKDGEPRHSPIARVFQDLGIKWITESSPQLRGYPERFFEHAHAEMKTGMRRCRIVTVESANRYLEDVHLPMWNQELVSPEPAVENMHR